MILSFRHRFVFVRARKVAGTSVEMALSTICGDQDIVPPMLPVDERTRQALGGFSGNYGAPAAQVQGYARIAAVADDAVLARLRPPPSRYTAHMTAAEVAAVAGVSLDALQTIAIVRDPYSRVISSLHMRRHLAGYASGIPMPAEVDRLAAALDETRAKGGFSGPSMSAFYGERIDHLLRHETLAGDLGLLCRSLGVPPPALPHAKRGALAHRLDPAEVFRRDQLDWINAHYADDFARFGYPQC